MEIKINEGIKKVIENSVGAFATIDTNGNPHNIAVGFMKVVSDDEVLITDNYMKDTIENIKRNNNTSLLVWIKDWEKECMGYELKGTSQYFTEGEWIDFIKKIPENKDEPCKGAILVKINKIKVLG